jgi:hypothetical protein
VRLYLSSYRVGDRGDALRAPEPGARAGVVLNALDAVGSTRGRSVPRETDDLEQLGYRCEELDLRGSYAGYSAVALTDGHGRSPRWVVTVSAAGDAGAPTGRSATFRLHPLARCGWL